MIDILTKRDKLILKEYVLDRINVDVKTDEIYQRHSMTNKDYYNWIHFLVEGREANL